MFWKFWFFGNLWIFIFFWKSKKISNITNSTFFTIKVPSFKKFHRQLIFDFLESSIRALSRKTKFWVWKCGDPRNTVKQHVQKPFTQNSLLGLAFGFETTLLSIKYRSVETRKSLGMLRTVSQTKSGPHARSNRWSWGARCSQNSFLNTKNRRARLVVATQGVLSVPKIPRKVHN